MIALPPLSSSSPLPPRTSSAPPTVFTVVAPVCLSSSPRLLLPLAPTGRLPLPPLPPPASKNQNVRLFLDSSEAQKFHVVKVYTPSPRKPQDVRHASSISTSSSSSTPALEEKTTESSSSDADVKGRVSVSQSDSDPLSDHDYVPRTNQEAVEEEVTGADGKRRRKLTMKAQVLRRDKLDKLKNRVSSEKKEKLPKSKQRKETKESPTSSSPASSSPIPSSPMSFPHTVALLPPFPASSHPPSTSSSLPPPSASIPLSLTFFPPNTFLPPSSSSSPLPPPSASFPPPLISSPLGASLPPSTASSVPPSSPSLSSLPQTPPRLAPFVSISELSDWLGAGPQDQRQVYDWLNAASMPYLPPVGFNLTALSVLLRRREELTWNSSQLLPPAQRWREEPTQRGREELQMVEEQTGAETEEAPGNTNEPLTESTNDETKSSYKPTNEHPGSTRKATSNQETGEPLSNQELTDAVRRIVRERLGSSPAHQLLKARFLSIFTMPALLASLQPITEQPQRQEPITKKQHVKGRGVKTRRRK